jgi:hypothetical protein
MRLFVTSGILAACLALTANAAMAAPTQINPIPSARYVSPARVAHAPVYGAPRFAVRGYAPRFAMRAYAPHYRLGAGVGPFVRGMLGGGPIPYAGIIRDARSSYGSAGASYSPPSYDNSAPASCAACDAQAASDEENQAIQEMNDINAMNASNAAAAAQNAADTAATIQTEINAGM